MHGMRDLKSVSPFISLVSTSFDVIKEVQIIELTAFIQRVHEGYVLGSIMTSRVQPVLGRAKRQGRATTSHGYVAEHTLNEFRYSLYSSVVMLSSTALSRI